MGRVPELSREINSRPNSRYLRRVADLPWHGIAVRLELHPAPLPLPEQPLQRIFCERQPRVVAHYARKTVRLNAALELIGFALGGEAYYIILRNAGFSAVLRMFQGE